MNHFPAVRLAASAVGRAARLAASRWGSRSTGRRVSASTSTVP
ncbi:hypothetical protein [Kitasatospora sp. CB02891]|nr:hypothetical protein [Kitasatospora sp. CB02891]